MTLIVIRSDSSNQIGSGHIVRCRTIARELKRQGAKIIFVCRDKPGNLINLVNREFETIIITESINGMIFETNHRKEYEEWLGCSEEQDATEFLSAIRERNCGQIDWLIVDHYGISEKWESIVLKDLQIDSNTKMLVIDDLADRKHVADILVDQNYFGNKQNSRYESLTTSTCTKLLGTYYAILGQEYAQLNPIIPKREEIKRILIFFGGADNDGLTLKTLKAIDENKYTQISFDIIVGMQSMDWDEINKITNARKNMKIHTGLNSLAGIMARADLAIGGCGTTTWERACLNLPSICITVAKNQEEIATALHNGKWINLIGKSTNICSRQIQECIDKHLANECILNEGIKLTDGYGCKRISMILMKKDIKLSLREVAESDEGLLLEWANDSSVRMNSFNNEKINEKGHHQWFTAGLKNKDRLHYIAVNEENCPIGQIRFDRGKENIEIDFSLDTAIRGRGIGTKLLEAGLRKLKSKWGNGYNVIGNVLENNLASSRSFEKSGFSKLESKESGSCRWHLNL